MNSASAIPGPLNGVRVIELASSMAASAGKLLADLGADVVLVEPLGGHITRACGPFVDDQPGPDRSLYFWYYNTSKRSVELAVDTPEGARQFRALVAGADLVLEAEPAARLGALGLDHTDLCPVHPALIWVSVTPFGRQTPSCDRPATDLTLQAGGGPAWNCGYDDHRLPPLRGAGTQGYQIGSVFAAMSALTAYLFRLETGTGQHIDVSLHAAANVTTEMGSVMWLVAGQTVQRQTGRHAWPEPTMDVQVKAADGRHVTTGFPPSDAKDYAAVLAWLDELGLRDAFAEAFLLELGVTRGGIDPRDMENDAEAQAIYSAGREALCFIAANIPSYDFFLGSQKRDFQCGIVYAPEEALDDPHFRARGFPTRVEHEELGRTAVYPGAPYQFSRTPWRISRRPPLVGEHNRDLLAE